MMRLIARTRALLGLVAVLSLPQVAGAQTLVITNGIHAYTGITNTVVTVGGHSELHVTATSNPIPGSLINLISQDSWFLLPQIRPSVVVSSLMPQIRVNGAVAVADSNCRVVQYGVGAVVIPHASSFQPLEVFSGSHFTGNSASLGQYVYYRGAQLGALNANISSFRLKRGYTATLAQNENGSGISRNYVAQDGDMQVSVLPGDLDNRVRFVYVAPWRWVSKKGSCDASPSDLNAQWWYNWNISENSTRDREYVAIKQQPFWPGLNQNWQTRGVNHLSGFNEPDNPVEDAYENLSPPGSVSDAVARWPELLGTGLRVGAPAVTDGGQSWITDFMNQAEAAGMRVDYVPIHYYRCFGDNNNAAGAASQLYNFLKGIYDVAKRPLWVTEFNNGANWTGCADPTYAQNAAVIQAMIQMMDNTPWIERYSIYSRVEFTRQTHYDEGGLTPMGVMYRDHVAPLAYLQGLQDNGTRSFSEIRFDGDSLDSSGYGNNGLISGAPTYTNGHRGQALVFDGVNTKFTLPPNIANNNAFTFAAWVNWRGGGNWQRIFDFGNSTTHYMFLTPSSGSGTLRFAIRNGGGEQLVQSASALAQNQWQHVAVTLGGNIARLYINGVQVAINGSMTINPANFSPRVNFLGDSQFIADPLFKGMLDDVLITDYALSPSQIAALQTNTPPQFTNSVFDGGSATEGESYVGSIAGTAMDPDAGDTLTYSKAGGAAWLNVASNGALSGTPTAGPGGTNHFTVRVTDAAGQNAFAVLTINVTVTSASGAWVSDANGNWGDAVRWSGGVVANGAGQTADFSTINITANRTVTLDSNRSIGTLRFGDTVGGQSWTLAPSGGSELTLDTGSSAMPVLNVANTATLNISLAGANGFAKQGTGTLVLGGNNSLSGTVNIDTSSTTVNEGVVRAAHPGALANVSLIQIRNNNDGSSTLQFDGSAGGIVSPADFAVNCRNNDIPTIQNVAGTNTLTGEVSLNVGGNRFNIRSDAGQLVLGGQYRYVGTLTGGRSYAFSGSGDHLVTGPILNSVNGAPITLIKSGPGTLTLAANNTYGSTTTVSSGTLLVNGAIGSGALTVGNTATLGGSGLINGPTTIQFGGTVSPGASIGRLTVNNSLSLQGGSITLMEISGGPATNDQLRVTGVFTRSGSLVVTNVGSALAAGDSFQLFDAPNATGTFSSTNLPALSAGLEWDTSQLNSGVLSVVSVTPPQITAMTLMGDGNFQLGGIGAAGADYELQGATNLTPPVAWEFVTNAVADGAGLFELIDLEATNHPQRFYRVEAP